MKELHIKTGDVKRFLHQIQHALKKKKLVKKEDTGGVGSLFGMPIVLDERIPKNRAVLVDAKGEVKQIFNL